MVKGVYGERKSLLQSSLDVFIVIAGGFIALLAALQKFTEHDLDQFPGLAYPAAAFLRREAWWLVLLLALLAAVAKVWKERLAAAWVWSVVRAIVERIAQDAFKNIAGPQYRHRATLFRYQSRWCLWPFKSRFWPWGTRGGIRWPWSGWLLPVIRSGNTTQRSSTAFLAPDDPDHAEGIAGYAWASRREVRKSFPVVIDSDAQADDITHYARETQVPEVWVREQLAEGKSLAASFTGIPVEVRGRIWGVLVLDSRDPVVATNVPVAMAEYAFVLGKLLEKV